MEWKNQQTMHPTVSQKILLKHSSRKYWVWVIAFLIKNLLCLMGLYYLVFACVIINIMLFGFASNSRNILRYLVPRFETHKVNLSSYGLWFIKKRRGPQHRTTTLWQSPSEYVWVMSYQLSPTGPRHQVPLMLDISRVVSVLHRVTSLISSYLTLARVH